MIDRGSEHRLSDGVAREKSQPFSLTGPAEGVGNDLDLGIVAEFVAENEPKARYGVNFAVRFGCVWKGAGHRLF
jgi:hypothetical protein